VRNGWNGDAGRPQKDGIWRGQAVDREVRRKGHVTGVLRGMGGHDRYAPRRREGEEEGAGLACKAAGIVGSNGQRRGRPLAVRLAKAGQEKGTLARSGGRSARQSLRRCCGSDAWIAARMAAIATGPDERPPAGKPVPCMQPTTGAQWRVSHGRRWSDGRP
jgi:hypothetical protein